MKTDTEKRYATLLRTNGRRLDSNPAFLLLKHFLTKRCDVGGPNPWASESAQQKVQDQRVIPAVVCDLVMIIMTIEELTALMRQANSEVDESLEAIHLAYNKVKATKDVLIPDLLAMNHEIRQSRMTTEREMKQTLDYLKGVREYFMEKDYEREMARLHDFVALCKSIQALKDAGTLDAVADLAIRLAVGEVAK